MTDAKEISERLCDIDTYMNSIPQQDRATHFEMLVGEAFGHILNLPFFASDTEDTSLPHRVVWNGTRTPVLQAHGGSPDCVARCYGFYLTVEATLKTGANQWTQEFAQGIRHSKTLCSTECANPKDVLCLLVCKKLYEDTYLSIKQNPRPHYKVVPIETRCLARVLEVASVAVTLQHMAVRKLLGDILQCVADSSSPDEFSAVADRRTTEWQDRLLRDEKSALVSLHCYAAMQRIGRNVIGAGEIRKELDSDPFTERFLALTRQEITVTEVESCLMEQRLAYSLGSSIQQDEPLLERVPFLDFEARTKRFLDAVAEVA